MTTQSIATLNPEVRAAQLLSFDETKAQLTELAKQSERITQITNKAGRDECHSSLMVLKNRRVDIEKRGKDARDDANKFSRAVIAKENELIGFIKPEEQRLQLLRDQWDTAIEMERLQKLEAERLRVEAIQAKIQAIRDVPSSLVGKPSVIIAGQLAKLRADELSEDEFAEQFVIAREAHTTAIVRVEQLLAAQQEADAEKKRQTERDAEMEAMRKNQAEMQAKLDQAEAERVERERKAAAEEAERVAREAAEKRQREIEAQRRLDEIQARIDGLRCMAVNLHGLSGAELDETRRALQVMHPDTSGADYGEYKDQAVDVWETAEATLSQAAERRAQLDEEARQADARRAEEDARLQAERNRQAAAQKKLDEQAAQLKREREAAAKKAEADRLANLGLRDAAQAVVDHFMGQSETTPMCVRDLEAALANDAAQTKPARTKRVARA